MQTACGKTENSLSHHGVTSEGAESIIKQDNITAHIWKIKKKKNNQKAESRKWN